MPQMIQTIIDYLILVFSSLAAMTMCCNAIMKRRRRLTVYIVYVTVKTLIVNGYFYGYQVMCLGAEGTIRSIYMGLLILTAMLSYLFLLYTFDEDFVKIAIISMGAELFALVASHIGKTISAVLIGEKVYEEIPTLHPTDLLTPLITIGITYAMLKLGNKVVQRLRDW